MIEHSISSLQQGGVSPNNGRNSPAERQLGFGWHSSSRQRPSPSQTSLSSQHCPLGQSTGGKSASHWPARQTCVRLHRFPQAPQLLSSLCTVMHLPPHFLFGALHGFLFLRFFLGLPSASPCATIEAAIRLPSSLVAARLVRSAPNVRAADQSANRPCLHLSRCVESDLKISGGRPWDTRGSMGFRVPARRGTPPRCHGATLIVCPHFILRDGFLQFENLRWRGSASGVPVR